MRRMLGSALSALALALPLAAGAHPGHGAELGSPLHYLLEPEHALPLLGGAWVVALIVWRLRLTRRNSD